MQYKYTKDGKKVAVIGALNSTEIIVQEVFVHDGTEFPAGEHFTVRSLLDVPAETYQAAKAKELRDDILRMAAEKDRISRELSGLRAKQEMAFTKVKWISGISDQEVQDAIDRIAAMVRGEYTHVLMISRSGKIELHEWTVDTFASWRDRGEFDGFRLVSLFGEWNGRLKLDWRVNTYRDGSGSDTRFVPCKSLEEAKAHARGVIYAKDRLSNADHDFCVEYGIEVDEDKNRKRIEDNRRAAEKHIASLRETLAKKEAELASL